MAALVLAPGAARAQAPLAGATISGTVTSHEPGHAPLEDVCVRLLVPDGTSGDVPGLLARTDVQGRYALGGIPDGRYVVSFLPCSTTSPSWPHDGQLYDGVDDVADARVLDLRAGDVRTDVDAELRLGSALGGVVQDAAGHPITSGDICVSVGPLNDPRTARTDATGRWRVGGLDAGSYVVRAAPCADAPTRDDIGGPYDPTPEHPDGTPVPVGYHEDRLDLTQRLGPGTSIAGRITGDDGAGLPGWYAIAYDARTGGAVAAGVGADDGTFRIGRIPVTPDGVRVRVGTFDATDYVAVEVGGTYEVGSGSVLHPTVDAPLRDVAVPLAQGGSIAGLTRDADGDPLGRVCATPYLDGSDTAFDSYLSGTDGRFRLRALPAGTYAVRYSSCLTNDPQLGTIEPPQHVAVTARQTASVPDVTLRPGAILRGSVVSPADVGQDGCASAEPLDGPPEVPTLVGLVAYGDRYGLAGLTAGQRYVLRFDDCPGTDRFAPQWFDTSPVRGGAQELVLQPQEDRSGVDGELTPRGPQVRLTRAPGGVSSYRAATGTSVAFALPSDAVGAVCSLDGAPRTPCTSPVTTGELATGTHHLDVRALDDQGATGPPARASWSVWPGIPTDDATTGQLEPGESLSSPEDGLATAADPLAVALRVPVPAVVQLGAGFAEARGRDDGRPLAQPSDAPALLDLTLDASAVYGSPAPGRVLRTEVLLGGTSLSACPAVGSCVASTTVDATGDVHVAVRARALGSIAVTAYYAAPSDPSGPSDPGPPATTTTQTAPATPPGTATTTPADTTTPPAGDGSGATPPVVVQPPQVDPGAVAPGGLVPAPTPAAVPAPARRTTAPTLGKLRLPTLARALAGGLAVTVRCPGACVARARLSVDAATRRRLGLRAQTVGTATSATGALRVRFTAAARRKLARRRQVRLTLAVAVRSVAGTTTNLHRTVVLKAASPTGRSAR